jgi:hypothetical protein
MSTEIQGNITTNTAEREIPIIRMHGHSTGRAINRWIITTRWFSFKEPSSRMFDKLVCRRFVFKLSAKLCNLFMGIGKSNLQIATFFLQLGNLISKKRQSRSLR